MVSGTMRAALLDPDADRVRIGRVAIPRPAAGELLLRVAACGVCRTDLHLLDGELPPHGRPRILGHQIVGVVLEHGSGTAPGAAPVGARVGVAWLGTTCGGCRFCRHDEENLCRAPQFTGWDRDGGFAEYAVADARFCLPIPASYGDAEAAPLLCAGAIGFRAMRVAGDGMRLGLYGFGSAAHLLAQLARHEGREVIAFTRPGDEPAQRFARQLGAAWVGGSDQSPPEPLDAALIFAPVGALVPLALRAVRPGGRVVCAGIRMSEIPAFDYQLLWEERSVHSVANLRREDLSLYLPRAVAAGVRCAVTRFPLERTQEALDALRDGRFVGAAVIAP